MWSDGLKWIAAVLLIAIVAASIIKYAEFTEAAQVHAVVEQNKRDLQQARFDEDERIQAAIENNDQELRRVTLNFLNTIQPVHDADCKADTTIWSGIAAARERVHGMTLLLYNDVSPQITVASVEAGAQLRQAYEFARYACKGCLEHL